MLLQTRRNQNLQERKKEKDVTRRQNSVKEESINKVCNCSLLNGTDLQCSLVC